MTTVPVPNRLAVPATLAGQQPSARTATLEQLRERLESGEPPEKKATRLSEEEQRLVQQAFQRGLFSMARQLPMKIRVNGRGECGRGAAPPPAGCSPGLHSQDWRGGPSRSPERSQGQKATWGSCGHRDLSSQS